MLCVFYNNKIGWALSDHVQISVDEPDYTEK